MNHWQEKWAGSATSSASLSCPAASPSSPLTSSPPGCVGCQPRALPGPSASFRPPSKLERKQSKDQGGSEATRVTTVAVPNITPRDVASQEAAARRKSRAPSQSLGTGQPCQSGEALATTNE